MDVYTATTTVTLWDKLITYDNIAILVLLFTNYFSVKFWREDQKVCREERKDMIIAIRKMTALLAQVRLDLASNIRINPQPNSENDH